MESQPLLKKRKTDSVILDNYYIIYYDECDENQKSPNYNQWNTFKKVATDWYECGGKYVYRHTRLKCQ